MDHIEVTRAQIAALQDEISRDPRIKALDFLKQALASLVGSPLTDGDDAVNADEAQTARPAEVTAERVMPTLTRKNADLFSSSSHDSKIKRVHDVIGAYIDAHGPTHRKKLYEVLVEAGVMKGDLSNPLSAVASSMSTLRRHFVSDGHGVFARDPNAPTELSPVWGRQPSVEPGAGSVGQKDEAARE